jgi:RNA 3'-terminal phosphate cyclase
LLRQASIVAAVAGGRHEEGLLAAEQAARVLRRQGVIAEPERVPLPVAVSAPARPRWAVTVLAEFESSIVATSELAPIGARVGAEREAASAAGDRVAARLTRFLSRRGALDAWTAERLLLPSFLSAAGLGARAGPPPSSHYTTSEVTQALVELATLARLALPVRAVVDGAVGEEGVVVVAPANLA